ncbi:MAG TPA: alpha/beta fold hydrolase [bacterium]|nr:alpha/beta fold hydrolase [bacterium]
MVCNRFNIVLAALCLSACRAPLYPATHLSRAAVEKLAAENPGWAVARIPDGGPELVGLERAPKQADAPWILFFGGNGTSLASSRSALLRLAGDDDAGLVAFAYRGYDASEGTPAEAGIESDALRIAAWLEKERGVAPSRLLLVGHSLGAAVAANLDAELSTRGEPPRGLALLAPFTTMRREANHVLPGAGCLVADGWPTLSRAPRLSAPVLVASGTADEVIPPEHGKTLAASLGAKATFISVAGAHHNDLLRHDEVVAAVRELLRSQARGAGSAASAAH